MRPHPITLGLVSLAALTTLVHCTSKNASTERTCVARLALGNAPLRGSSMAAKTLALTFDDGPGPRTRALSTFLKGEGIQAAFFVNGRSMGANAAEVLQQLVDDGHLIANHTETHQSLTGFATATPRPADAVIVEELTSTDTKIEPFVAHERLLFRPPFGDYDEQTHAVLASTPMNKYVGPVLWDVGDRMDEEGGYAADWDCWQDGMDGKRLSVEACGDLYLTEIRREGKGIVLMHDPYFNELDPDQGGTVEMVMYMVPKLKADGFAFQRVDMVPEIAALLPPIEPGGGTGGPGEPPAAPTDAPPAPAEAAPVEPAPCL